MKILITDDEPAIRLIIGRNLKALGHTIFEAPDGLAAWDIFQAESPQMVITDWNMPHLDGPTLIRRIRATSDETYTYIIMVTALDERAQLGKSELTAPDDYLTKPLDVDELLARVKIGERILRLEASLRDNKRRASSH